jgi:DNA-binding SARP family transcriptional activator/energy-coupling factor transporter ATP-binding protein EcfA2
MDPVIFLEKVRRPDLRGLVRERLERRTAALTDSAPHPVSLGLILGPPGSGKTTLLSHLAAASDAAAWYRVGTEDDDEIALTRHIGHTLGAALGAPEVIAAAAPGRIADLVRALDDPVIGSVQLIIDDLHEIAGTLAEQALESFLNLRPRKIRVILGSRRPPRINTSRMLVSGELIQLDGEDLRFRSWEVEQLFRAVYAAPLSPEAAAALTRRTGGWAAGLQLFHLATAQLSRAERERAVEELSGRSRLIRSYLARNFLDGLDPERRRFLLLTSTLGVLTGDICDALLDTSGSAAVLSELEREQLFTTTTDAGLTYHYHQVLQTHLEVVLVDEQGGRATGDLYSRSAELLERAGRPAAAIRAYAHAEDWGSVARLLKPDSVPVAGDEAMWGTLSLPGAPTDDPGLVLAGARRLARHGRIAEAVTAFRHAEALLDDPEFRRRCSAERSAVAVWLPQAALPSMPDPYDADPDSSLLRLSLELRQLTRQIRDPDASQQPLVRSLALLLTGDPVAAAHELSRADPGKAPTRSTPWEALAVRLVSRLVELLIRPADVTSGQIEEIMLGADVEGWPWLSRLARSLQTALLLAVAPEPWRISAATDLLGDLERREDHWTLCLSSLAIGVAYAGIDEPALAARTLKRAEGVAAELGAPVLQAWARLLRTFVAVHQGEPDADQEAANAVRAAAGLGVHHTAAAMPAVGRTAPMIRERMSSEAFDRLRPDLVEGLRTAPFEAGPSTSSGHSPSTSSGHTSITLRCLGGFSLAAGGVDLPWRELRPRARALLMLLAMNHGRQLHREQLVDALWPDATLASGIRSLQVAVSSIRQCLSAGDITEDALQRHGDAYALQLLSVSDQLADFEQLAQTAARARPPEALRLRLAALDRYAGDLLPEVGPAEWVVEERTRLRLLAAEVASEAARDALAADDLRTALDTARRSVALDPYHDSSWELIVKICERLDDHSAAAVARREQAQVWVDLGLVAPGVLPHRTVARRA